MAASRVRTCNLRDYKTAELTTRLSGRFEYEELHSILTVKTNVRIVIIHGN